MAKITRKNLNKHRDELQTLLSEYAKKHNMTIDVGRITFTPDSFRFKAEFINDSLAHSNWGADEPMFPNGATGITPRDTRGEVPFGCQQSWIGRTFRTSPRGGLHTITKFRPNASKNVVIAESARGTEYVWSAAEIANHLKD